MSFADCPYCDEHGMIDEGVEGLRRCKNHRVTTNPTDQQPSAYLTEAVRDIRAAELADSAVRALDAVPGLDGGPDHFLLSSIAYSLASLAKSLTVRQPQEDT